MRKVFYRPDRTSVRSLIENEDQSTQSVWIENTSLETSIVVEPELRSVEVNFDERLRRFLQLFPNATEITEAEFKAAYQKASEIIQKSI